MKLEQQNVCLLSSHLLSMDSSMARKRRLCEISNKILFTRTKATNCVEKLDPSDLFTRTSELSRCLDIAARLPFDLRNLRAGQSRVSAPFLEENAEFLSLVI